MSDRPKLFSPRAGSRGMDELQYAAYCGDVEAVRYFLAAGADVSKADDFGWTALHWNARMSCTPGDRIAIVNLLVGAGAEVNRKDNECRTVLDNALEATASDEMLAHLRSLGAA